MANALYIKTLTDNRGSLSVLEQLPFDIKRVYYLHGIDTSSMRGGHAHKQLKRIMVCVAGSVIVKVRDDNSDKIYELNHPTQGLEINPMEWLELTGFAEGTVCMVLASLEHDENDCIRDFEEYKEMLHRYNTPRSQCDCNQGRLECKCIRSVI